MAEAQKTKSCARCKLDKPADPEHFIRNKAKEDGLDLYCKPCRREYQKEFKKGRKDREKKKLEDEAGKVDEVVGGTEEVPVINKKWFLKEIYGIYSDVKGSQNTQALRCLELIAKVGGLDKEQDMDEKAMIKSLMESARRSEEIEEEVGGEVDRARDRKASDG